MAQDTRYPTPRRREKTRWAPYKDSIQREEKKSKKKT